MPKIETQPFYNVMPEASGGKRVLPKKVNASKAAGVFGTKTPAATGPTATNITLEGKKHGFLSRKAILIPLIIIVLAVIGIPAWLIIKSTNKPEEQPINTTPTEQVGDPDVTTPGDWLARYFGSETCVNKNQCADASDPDHDGYTNKEEFDGGTDPNNPDSDSDGIADGDEKHIFSTDPLISRTYREGEYNDADFVKGGYDINSNTAYSAEQLVAIKAKIKEKGLHQPTLTTIGIVALELYDFKDPNSSLLDELNIDQSPQAKLDRDTQRQSTIKKIGGALLIYKNEKKSFPAGSDFVLMSDAIRSYNTVATNYNDPINKDKYVYGYTAGSNNQDFTLTYYSETQNQLIKYMAKDAQDAAAKENAEKNNEQRMSDLENIKSALLVYSSTQSSSQSNNTNVFPTQDQYPNILVENRLITAVPKDPSGAPYSYQVNASYDSFTLKAVFENPPKGVTGYTCNEIECKNY